MTQRARVRLAALLWIVLAVVVWNVVFDRVLVVAGRQYAHDAAIAAKAGQPYLRIDDRMRPAIAHGVKLATAIGAVIAALGLGAVALAARRDRPPAGR